MKLYFSIEKIFLCTKWGEMYDGKSDFGFFINQGKKSLIIGLSVLFIYNIYTKFYILLLKMSDKKLSEGLNASGKLPKKETYFPDNEIEKTIALFAKVQNALKKLKESNCVSEKASSFEGIEGKDVCIKIPGSEDFNFFISNEPMYSKDYAENEKIKESLCSPARIEDLLNAIGRYVKKEVKECNFGDISYKDLMHSKGDPEFNYKINSKGEYIANYNCQQGDWLKEITGWKERFHVKNPEGDDNGCFFWDMWGIYCRFSCLTDVNGKLLIERK